MLTVLILAVGLAMDSFSASLSGGLACERLSVNEALRIAFFFGVFQAVMPLIGWLAGRGVHPLISEIDHWVAFGLLTFIGLKMIYQSASEDDNNVINLQQLHVLLALSVATSIDAFAVGIGLSILGFSIAVPSVVFGTVTFLLSLLGVFISRKLRRVPSRKVESLGGVILIAIGLKILSEHLFCL